ncbi:MAG: CBS domain-containing protein [Bacteroidia bacterium]
MKISASIYSSPDRSLADIVADLDAHGIEYFHVDCNDDPRVFADIDFIRQHSKTPIDLHIITADPEKYFSLLAQHPPDYVTFQYEDVADKSVLKRIPKNVARRLGFAITAVSDPAVFEEYADVFDFVLLMATIPGKSGGAFNKDIFRKIRQVKKRWPEKRVHVDGGVNGEVSFILRNMGVYASVSGSYLFKAASIGLALLNLKSNEHESHFQVRDFMLEVNEIPTLLPRARSFENILHSIEAAGLGFTILVDETNLLQGIISNADVRKGLLKNINALEKISAADLTNENPVTVNEHASVQDLLRLIKSKQFPISYLPVVNDRNEVVGALTFFNLIKGEA